MYKNFNLTESEREQILKQHKKYGYKNPLNEQSEEGMDINPANNDGSEEDMRSSNGLIVEDHIYIPVDRFTVYVKFDDESDEVPVEVSKGENGEPIFDVADYMIPDDGNVQDYINAIKQKMGNNPFYSLKYSGAVLNYETGETENY